MAGAGLESRRGAGERCFAKRLHLGLLLREEGKHRPILLVRVRRGQPRQLAKQLVQHRELGSERCGVHLATQQRERRPCGQQQPRTEAAEVAAAHGLGEDAHSALQIQDSKIRHGAKSCAQLRKIFSSQGVACHV